MWLFYAAGAADFYLSWMVVITSDNLIPIRAYLSWMVVITSGILLVLWVLSNRTAWPGIEK